MPVQDGNVLTGDQDIAEAMLTQYKIKELVQGSNLAGGMPRAPRTLQNILSCV